MRSVSGALAARVGEAHVCGASTTDTGWLLRHRVVLMLMLVPASSSRLLVSRR